MNILNSLKSLRRRRRRALRIALVTTLAVIATAQASAQPAPKAPQAPSATTGAARARDNVPQLVTSLQVQLDTCALAAEADAARVIAATATAEAANKEALARLEREKKREATPEERFRVRKLSEAAPVFSATAACVDRAKRERAPTLKRLTEGLDASGPHPHAKELVAAWTAAIEAVGKNEYLDRRARFIEAQRKIGSAYVPMPPPLPATPERRGAPKASRKPQPRT